MIVIHVDYQVKPECVEEFRDRLRRHAKNSLGEPGCLTFDVAQADDDATRFFIWEIYTDDEAVKYHGEQASLAEFRELAGPMTVSREVAMAKLVSGD
jgi:autoinducer 2-degrading protein